MTTKTSGRCGRTVARFRAMIVPVHGGYSAEISNVATNKVVERVGFWESWPTSKQLLGAYKRWRARQ